MFKQALAICIKDYKSELRTRYAINALAMFIIVVISVIKFSIGEEKLSNELHAGLLWIIIFFSNSSGLARVFVSEEERGTSLFLKLTADSNSVLLGKLIFNISLTFIINFLIIILFILATELKINSPRLFSITIILGNFGFASVLTIIAALISKANTKGTLYPVLSFPLLLPLLLAVINATWLSIEGVAVNELSVEFQIIISYTIVVITASFLLFGTVWND
ncbi:MAG: heme exporter protein CcmB [Ignavibacteria bacterium]